jgi:three-Cys-motif partner protein
MSPRHYDWKIGEPPPELGAHSRAKHTIFEQYVEIYIDRLTRMPAQTMLNLTLVDGFCGGGIYRDGSGIAEGSPLRLIHAVERAEAALKAARTKGFTIHIDCFFVDENEQHIAFLKDLLIKRGYGSRLEQNIFLRHSSFEDVLPNIINFIMQKGPAQRSLFFLDQYGWSDVRLATIRKILTSLANPEIRAGLANLNRAISGFSA